MRASRWMWMMVVLCVAGAHAEPQYSAVFGQSCFLCHSNPSGRGMRSLYGSQFFAPNYLPVKPVSEKTLAKLNPRLSDIVQIGLDYRTIWMAETTPSDTISSGLSAPFSTNTGTDAMMAATLHFSVEPSSIVSFHYSQNLVNTTRRYEAYGLANILPYHGYLKAGRFQENFGWAFADHSAFVRTGLWEGYDGTGSPYAPPTPPRYGIGAEAGLRPEFPKLLSPLLGETGLPKIQFDLTGSLTQDADLASPGPMDTQKRWNARIMAQSGIEALHLQFTAGGSWMHAPPAAGQWDTRQVAWGGFGGIGWQGFQNTFGCKGGFGFLTTSAMFEYDRKDRTLLGERVTSAYSTAQLSVMLQPGIWGIAAYDWLDNGSSYYQIAEASRSSFGLQVFPWPWVDILPLYRLYAPAVQSGHTRNIQHLECQLHLWF